MPMGEMPAVGEIHRQNPVARFNGGEIDGHVGLRAAVRLHVDVFRAEDSLGAIDRELLRPHRHFRSRHTSVCPDNLRRTCSSGRSLALP